MKLNIKIFSLLFLILSIGCSKKTNNEEANPPLEEEKEVTFSNPLLDSGPDPWVIKKDSLYYYMHTLGSRIAIWKTKAMSELRKSKITTVWNAPQVGANSRNIWAPELHRLNDKWYLYYTAGASSDLSTQRTFVLENSSADPTTGSWTEKGQIKDPKADFFAIDGTTLEYKGKNYFIWSGHISATDNTQRLYIARMADPWTLETERVEISSPQYGWERVGSPAVNEGPQVLKNKEGHVFLVYSASGCWTDDYSLGMLRLKVDGDPLLASDWTKSSQPVFTKRPESNAFGPGHNSFFKSADGTEDWIIYHANSSPGLGCADARSPRIQEFSWNADGTPNFGMPLKIFTKIDKPSGE